MPAHLKRTCAITDEDKNRVVDDGTCHFKRVGTKVSTATAGRVHNDMRQWS